MSVLRRILGILVMIAGLIGLLISLSGLVGLWIARPRLTSTADATLTTLTSSLTTSQKALVITEEALGATVDSVDALADMLHNTAQTVDDTQPVITQLNGVLGETLPNTFEDATVSLQTAGEAARSLESAIKSFETFQTVLAATPFLSAFVPAGAAPYTPEKPLAESLEELSAGLDDMPATFVEISANLDKADNNLELVKANLDTMSANAELISTSLGQYQAMIGESKASMTELHDMLANLQGNLPSILNAASIALGLFFLWLLAAQAVIFSQGWELYHGTAGHMEGGIPEPTPDPAPEG